jgi:ABC-type Fe3+/spermidine/putrescine transport system ATPase subunit
VLSGGQQQRVALARALVGSPQVLLLDEPLSNLDAHLREQMRFEIRNMQVRLGITTIFVTHDQVEAMTLSDHIVVMNAGHIEQRGAPKAVYQQPRTRYVMEFLGQVNTLPARVERVDGTLCAVAGGGAFAVDGDDWHEGEAAAVAVRSEGLRLVPAGGQLHGRVVTATYLGASTEYLLDVDGGQVRVEVSADMELPTGASVEIAVCPGSVKVWKIDE